MTDKELQINSIKRQIGSLTFMVAITQLREAISDFSDTELGIEKIENAIKGFGMSVTPLDEKYYYTSWDNWQKIISVLNPIVSNFKWEAERFDCDNRSLLVSSLCSLMFKINTCASVYCDVYDVNTGVYKYRHYANLIVDDNSNVYLWDVDQGGMYQKITSNNVVMGVNKYYLMNVRAF